MIGVDLVDLKRAELDSNWKRKRYLQKIFTKEEQELICNYNDSNLMVWILWSMKEAAYKIWSRNTGHRVYAPTSLRCENIQITEFINGTVTHLDRQYFTQSNLNEDYVCTIATTERSQLTNIKVNLSNSELEYSQSAPTQSRSHHGRYLVTAWL